MLDKKYLLTDKNYEISDQRCYHNVSRKKKNPFHVFVLCITRFALSTL